MAERDELFSEVGDDPLGAAIKPWRHAFDQRRNLRDFHCVSRLPQVTEHGGPRVGVGIGPFGFGIF